MGRTRILIFTLFFLIALVGAAAADKAAATSPAKDKCPVCGMFVAKYPDWVASLTFKDASIVYFDGAKDMFTFCLNTKKYSPSKSSADIAAVAVKDYYSLKVIDGRTAYFVVGSDVYGPMGKELVPFAREADAREFLKDHKGKKIVRFGDVTPALMKTVE